MDFLLRLPFDIVTSYILPKLDGEDLLCLLKWIDQLELPPELDEETNLNLSQLPNDFFSPNIKQIQNKFLPRIQKLLTYQLENLPVTELLNLIIKYEIHDHLIKQYLMEINNLWWFHQENGFLKSYYTIFLSEILRKKNLSLERNWCKIVIF